ncbi:MAG: PEP-CTERM sorting domain-containing protein [Planctomycetes bacterium]|nr:PEP-CTERM sorting domain-containing protein [Planctomycetota bacterium]
MKRIKLKLTQAWLLSAISFGLPMAAEAALVTINNPSFESPVTPSATFSGGQTTGPTDWTVYNSGATNNERFFGVWNPSTTNSFVNGAPDGANVGVVFLENTTNLAEAGLQQTLTATLQLSTQYTLTVDVGNFSDADGGPFNFTGFPGYRVELFAGSTLIASDLNTLSPSEGIFETSVVSFATGISHANLGQTLAIRLVNLNGPGIEVNFDNVRLDASPVPEPSTVGLGVLGMMCVLLKRHRISRNA